MTRVRIALLGIMISSGWIAAAVWAAHSRAETLDELYVENLHEVGIYAAAGDAGLIEAGHMVCDAFRIGESFSDAETLLVSNNPKLSSIGAAQIIGAATAAYCPSYAWKFGAPVPSTASATRGQGVLA